MLKTYLKFFSLGPDDKDPEGHRPVRGVGQQRGGSAVRRRQTIP